MQSLFDMNFQAQLYDSQPRISIWNSFKIFEANLFFFQINMNLSYLLNFVPKIRNASAKSSLVLSEPHLLACHFTLASTREKPVRSSVLLSFGQKIG